MKQKNWDEYFYSHYHPQQREWSREDLEKYKRWYIYWIQFIKKNYSLSFSGKTALELGCAIGAITSLLNEDGCEIVGSDISEIIIKHAQHLCPDIPFITYDVMKPYAQNRKVDFVFAFEVLEHIPFLDLALKNIYSLLKPNGYFIGSTPYPYRKNMIDPTHVNVHLPAYWKTIFYSHGFKTVHTIPMSFFPFIWKLPFGINPIITNYIPFPGFVSTTLIVAKK